MSADIVIQTKTILIVEDDKAIYHALHVLLRHYEYEVKLAHTLAEGLQHISAEEPHILVLDLNLPDGDGLKILEKVRMANMQSKVIVLSACSEPARIRRAKILKPEMLMQKPFEFYDLLAALKELL